MALCDLSMSKSETSSIKDPVWVQRIVTVFSNADESLVEVHQLEGVVLSQLQKQWSEPEIEPMFACFPIEEDQREFIEELIECELNFEVYSYFAEAVCIDSAAAKSEGGFMGQFAPPAMLRALPNRCSNLRATRRNANVSGRQTSKRRAVSLTSSA